jgi:hypothetical protein
VEQKTAFASTALKTSHVLPITVSRPAFPDAWISLIGDTCSRYYLAHDKGRSVRDRVTRRPPRRALMRHS